MDLPRQSMEFDNHTSNHQALQAQTMTTNMESTAAQQQPGHSRSESTQMM